MNTIRNVSGIYAWTDVSRNQSVFKLGCASDILYRIEGEERKETSNIGTIKILFILECTSGNEKQFEKAAHIWLKERKARLSDHFPEVHSKKEWFIYENIQELEEFCRSLPYFAAYYGSVGELPTSKKMITERMKSSHYFSFFPESLLQTPITIGSKKEKSDDIEYTSRKKYFEENQLCLQTLLEINKNCVVIKKQHRFTFTKNLKRSSIYSLSDFKHDLDTKRLKIIL